MTTWPSANKAVTTTTDADTDTISGARVDINKTISNVNDIIDIFNIPASPTNDYILRYDTSTGKFQMEAGGGGGGLAFTNINVDDIGVYIEDEEDYIATDYFDNDFVEADIINDVLTFNAGTGISFTQDTATDTITISSTVTSGGIDDVVEDTTPQLGGNLDVNGNSIFDSTDDSVAFTDHIQASNAKSVRFADSDSSNYVGLKSPATVGTSYTMELPATAPTDGQFLKADSSGNLVFGSQTASPTDSYYSNSITGTTLALDRSNGRIQYYTSSASTNVTVTMNGMNNGDRLTLVIKNTHTGINALAFGSEFIATNATANIGSQNEYAIFEFLQANGSTFVWQEVSAMDPQ